jgi:hypothetical protein
MRFCVRWDSFATSEPTLGGTIVRITALSSNRVLVAGFSALAVLLAAGTSHAAQ